MSNEESSRPFRGYLSKKTHFSSMGNLISLIDSALLMMMEKNRFSALMRGHRENMNYSLICHSCRCQVLFV